MGQDDTSERAREVYWKRLSEMTPSEKTRIVAELWDAGHRLQVVGMRQRFPNADEAEILFRIAVTRFGEELARKVYKR